VRFPQLTLFSKSLTKSKNIRKNENKVTGKIRAKSSYATTDSRDFGDTEQMKKTLKNLMGSDFAKN
jgi:hypothetical protein